MATLYFSGYASINIENDPYNGGVKIQSTSLGSSTSATVIIERRESGTTGWATLDSVSTMDFDAFDILALSGHSYDYQVTIGSTYQIAYNIKCWFDGLFVGNFNKHYVAGTNFKTETKRHMSVEHVETLASKYPFRVSNANLNYTTGTSTGLFLELTDDKKQFKPDSYHVYSNQVLGFICDGSNKIVKTHDGQAWYVSIDKEPSKVYSDYVGMNAIQFSWTEIGFMPSSGLAGV